MRQQLIVIQPTPFCNLRCRYCYLPDRDSHQKMSDEVLQAILSNIEHSDLVSDMAKIVWHAGEPLTVGKEFFRRALQATRDINLRGKKTFSHSVQTNGVLLDETWLDIFQPHDVKIGLSIDGPPELHDLHRRTRQGRGTHDRVLKAVRLLHAHRYPFSVIMVITRDALERADEVFDFFASSGIRVVGLNVEELESANVDSTLRGSEVEKKLHQFYLRLLQRQEASGRAVRFREFEQFLPLLNDPATCKPESVFRRSSVVVPLSILNFDVNGNFSTFCPELLGSDAPEFNNFHMGNVLSDDVDSLLGKPVFQRVDRAIAAGVQQCEEKCHYWNFCGGGNAANKLFEAGSLSATETAYCRQHKQIMVDAVLDYVERRCTLTSPTG